MTGSKSKRTERRGRHRIVHMQSALDQTLTLCGRDTTTLLTEPPSSDPYEVCSVCNKATQ